MRVTASHVKEQLGSFSSTFNQILLYMPKKQTTRSLLIQILGHVTEIKHDIAEIKRDVKEIKRDFKEIKRNIDGIKHHVEEISKYKYISVPHPVWPMIGHSKHVCAMGCPGK